MSYTLLVVDMQRGFLRNFRDDDDADNVVNGVQEAVSQAVKDNAEIIDLNYDYAHASYGPTIAPIRHLWRSYKKENPGKVKKVTKNHDGGGHEVLAAEPAHDNIRVCGINLGACVKETVKEIMANSHFEVEIIEEAVANSWGGVEDDLYQFEEILI